MLTFRRGRRIAKKHGSFGKAGLLIPIPNWFAVSLLCGAAILLLAGCGSVPQVAEEEAVFKELDALYTAVTSKRRDLLDACRERMAKLHEDRKISDAGFAEVTAVVGLATEGKWTEASERLYKFMRAQRKTKRS